MGAFISMNDTLRHKSAAQRDGSTSADQWDTPFMHDMQFCTHSRLVTDAVTDAVVKDVTFFNGDI